jgi:hypothetical protein
MSLRVPLRVPVELRRGARWFRLAVDVSSDGLGFGGALPDELEGPVEVTFHLPGGAPAIRCLGRVEERVVGHGDDERAERRAIRFVDLDEAGQARIQQYVEERLGLT